MTLCTKRHTLGKFFFLFAETFTTSFDQIFTLILNKLNYEHHPLDLLDESALKDETGVDGLVPDWSPLSSSSSPKKWIFSYCSKYLKQNQRTVRNQSMCFWHHCCSLQGISNTPFSLPQKVYAHYEFILIWSTMKAKHSWSVLSLHLSAYKQQQWRSTVR